MQTDILRRTYKAPRQSATTLGEYGGAWIQARPRLKDSTRHQYGIDFRLHIAPHLGGLLLDKIDPAIVRAWHSTLSADLRAGLATPTLNASRAGRRDGTATVARCYRLLRTILQTAVDDELLVRNPCRIVGASDTRSGERPTLSVADMAVLAKAVPPHYRALVI
nr:hypothetical protein [Geodermatophilaceae bacterium]